jgi:malate dehydrogenase
VSFVAILGAGEIGGSAARALARGARVDLIRLIDGKPNLAAGKALDLLQASPISGSDTKIEGATDFAAAAGATAIVLADEGSTGAEWSGEPGLALLRRLLQLGCFDNSVLVCAGASQLALMQQAIDELGLPRTRTLGSAPEAVAGTARALVALEARAAAAQIVLTVLGRPPDKMVIPWPEASIAGQSIGALLNAPQLNSVERRLRGLWPPAPGALGHASARFAEAVATGSRRVFSAFVSLDRDNGTRAPVCAWPVSVGPSGLERIGSPALTQRDQVVLDEVLE